ncbi:MAG TPA: TIGR04255 family protein [Candidatus Acidoferrales bacterium]|nr:TIGR04255 family protein [Candidatus Acidoferrales bacterium]
MTTKSVDALPSYDRILFPAPHLELALVQVKFPPLPRFEEQNYLTDIREALSVDYPLPAVERAVNVMVSPQGVSQIPGSQVFRFSSLDYAWSVVLTADAVLLESRVYPEINEFAARFCAILEKVRNTLKPRHQLRFGLRYVNEFRHTKAVAYERWAELGLNRELLGIGARNVFGGNVKQTVNEFRTNRSDGSLVIRHGYLNGTTVAPAAGRTPKSGPFYLLDLDYFDESARDFDARPIDRMILFNDFLYRVFRWCVGDGELYQYLRAD